MKKTILFLFLITFSITAGWAQFYKDLTYPQRKELAEAYYLAGNQYTNVGKSEKGEDFIQMAFRIYPDLEPEKIEAREMKQPEEVKIVGTWQPKYNPIPRGVTAENSIKYHFTKMVRGFLSEDTGTVLETVDKRIYVPGVPSGMPKAELNARLQYLFLQEDIKTIPPSRLFDLQSISVSPVNRFIWKAEISAADNQAIDLSGYLGTGQGKTYTFFFRVVGETWLIFAYGELPSNAGRIVSPEESIKDTMVACIQTFAEQKPEAASRFFTDPFLNIPYGKEIDRDELVETFIGYLEEYDFSSLGTQKIDFSISESERVPHPGGKAYKVKMSFSQNNGEKLPFWESLTGYYLVFDERENAWRIFAIF